MGSFGELLHEHTMSNVFFEWEYLGNMKNILKNSFTPALFCLLLVGCATAPGGMGYSQGYGGQNMTSRVAPALVQAGLSVLSGTGNGLPGGVSSAISSVSNQLLGQAMYSPSPYYQRASYNPGSYGYQNPNALYPNANRPYNAGQPQAYRPTVPAYFGY